MSNPKYAKKTELHPRSRHRDRYDFELLVRVSPALTHFVARNDYGDLSVDFGNPAAVKALNRALLELHYSVRDWDIPVGYLCPPIPGRADAIHHLADLLAEASGGDIPRGDSIRVLDIGTGANCIYPLIGRSEYGWRFVATDVDPVALDSADRILRANPMIAGGVELRLHESEDRIFEGVIKPQERFDLSLCNPPFHSSAEEARAGSNRKWNNLGKKAPNPKAAPVLNFGGTSAELWCEGGERAFIGRMIAESVRFAGQCRWFTSIVSKEANLPGIESELQFARPREIRLIEMAQGQKRSRIVAWSFHASPSTRTR